MATTKKLTLFLVGTLATLIIIVVISLCCNKDKMSVVKDLIDADLPTGEPKENVHAWVTGKGWQGFEFDIATDEMDQWSGKSLADHAGVDNRQIASWIRVTIVSDSDSTLWPKFGTVWPRRFVIYFLFDKDSKLIKYMCKEQQVMS